MHPPPGSEADFAGRLAAMTLKDKVTLLTGADAWSLAEIPVAGLRSLRLSDGPSGPRGTAFGPDAEPSLLFPNTTSLAATWDVEAAREAGELMGARAREMGLHVLLAPTVNLHRSPLGGRHFECFSEDPLLTARMAAPFIEGVQSAGVAACVKHFVGNDTETERMSYDARIDEATLREVYLPPFEAAVREAGAWSVMAAYNRVNGTTMTEHTGLLSGLLKQEWGFDGAVISDWTAARSTEPSALAGLDVVMPGPMGPWGDALIEAVEQGRVPAEAVDDKILRILRLAARVGALEGVEAPPTAPVPVDVRDRMRELAVKGSVLLRNDGILPLRGVRRIALVGPNAARLSAQGGGSAQVNPEYIVGLPEGLREVLGADAEITVHSGVFPRAKLDPLTAVTDPVSGEPGVRITYLREDGTVSSAEHQDPAAWWFPLIVADDVAEIRVEGVLDLTADGDHRLSVLGAGEYALRVPGQNERTCVLDLDEPDVGALALNPPSHTFIFPAPAGRLPVQIAVRPNRDLPYPIALIGLGYAEPRREDDIEFAAAVEAARAADVAVVVVGSDETTETEGADRTSLALPGRQDDLVRAVCAVNPRTVVVVNAGGPWLMPWAEEPAALLWAWFPGQEGGAAIARVLTGEEPGGRLPTTFPARAEDVPVLGTRPSDGVLAYAEGDLIGHRAYSAAGTAALFPFGHGLSYTTWEYLSASHVDGVLDVTVRNSGDRSGSEVVQVYLDAGDGPVRLAGFAAVRAAAGETVRARIPITDRVLEHWTDEGWRPRPGAAVLHVGRSSADLRLRVAL
ncbi:glycoside hydrolase family 3 C-terminal domain-containing protein [Actinocorallia aurea]